MRLSFIVVSLAIAVSDASGQLSTTGAYVSTSPKGDTIAVETYTRMEGVVIGDIHIASIHQRLAYTMSLNDSDLVTRMDVALRTDTGSSRTAPTQSFAVSFQGDSMRIQVGPNARSHAVNHGTLPWINPSFTLIEQIVRRAHTLDPSLAHRDSVPVYDLNSGPVSVTVQWVLPDSAVISFPNMTARAEVDLLGHVTGVLFPDGSIMRAHQLKH
jgi:hypothetical protein